MKRGKVLAPGLLAVRDLGMHLRRLLSFFVAISCGLLASRAFATVGDDADGPGIATHCERPLRSTTYKHLPSDGAPKDGIVDYKLINQLLASLQRTVRNGDSLPENFTAELTSPSSSEIPVGGILLTGVLSAPHVLAGKPVKIEVRREGLAVVVTVATSQQLFERDITPQDYLSVFPFRGPGQSLVSLFEGVQQNPLLVGWIELTEKH